MEWEEVSHSRQFRCSGLGVEGQSSRLYPSWALWAGLSQTLLAFEAGGLRASIPAIDYSQGSEPARAIIYD